MKVRKGFVSNSSSSSFIVIGPGYDISIPKLEDEYVIGDIYGETQFGWEPQIYDDMDSKINFAWIQASYVIKYNPEYMEMLIEVLKENLNENISVSDDFYEGFNDLTGVYIDHQSSSQEGQNIEMFDSKETLYNFLFDEKSYIHVDNDNRQREDED